MNVSGLSLLRSDVALIDQARIERATVFATPAGVTMLRDKIEQFRTENRQNTVENGQQVPGRPKHANLVQSLGTIDEAKLRALWRGPVERLPKKGKSAVWEVWLNPDGADAFTDMAREQGLDVGTERLRFPEDIVVSVTATQKALIDVIRRSNAVHALAGPGATSAFFMDLDAEEQDDWTTDLADRTIDVSEEDPSYVTLLDTGVSRAHPLIKNFLAKTDRHAAYPAWSADDVQGHGTKMAGLALYGDLRLPLSVTGSIKVRHHLESAKIVPDTGTNPHHLLGAVTRRGIDAVETTGTCRRTFTLATTTRDDMPHDGAPTSWSTELDQLSAGVSGALPTKRLVVVSAGNADGASFTTPNYLNHSDHPDNELESPAQAWNPVCVGAYTEKDHTPSDPSLATVAPHGDLSPSSRTASWSAHWPLKPDIVLEGGNWVVETPPPPMTHDDLCLLSTSHQYPRRALAPMQDTSAATALAARDMTELWTNYPALWPETVRALYVGSARWTGQMLSHLPASAKKGDFERLFRRYGYGVPDLERAQRSASNAVTLIVEDEFVPFGLSEKTGGDVLNELRLFELPWPVDALRALSAHPVTLRVALSSFIAPNPSEAARGTRYRYASHNLRFKLNRSDETQEQFLARIGKATEAAGPASTVDDHWRFGSDRRDVGSLHIDELTCSASDLARRRLLAVHPVTGWWKNKKRLQEKLPKVRYALVVEIDAGTSDTDLYAEVATAVADIRAASPRNVIEAATPTIIET